MMNELASENSPLPAGGIEGGLAISKDTQALITASVSENTLRNYRFWSREIEQWLDGRSLNDGLLAAYITHLHTEGKSRASIGQAVAVNCGDLTVGQINTKLDSWRRLKWRRFTLRL